MVKGTSNSICVLFSKHGDCLEIVSWSGQFGLQGNSKVQVHISVSPRIYELILES